MPATAPERKIGRPLQAPESSPALDSPGARLANARLRARMSQAQLAKAMGSSTSSVSRAETDDRRFTLEWTYQAAAALQVPPSSLDPRLTDAVPPALP